MINYPLVSIIVPVHNSASFLDETILSVIRQTYTNWELIIIDDFSIDSSLKIAHKFVAQDNRVKLISLRKNEGVSYARNEGIKKSKGSYIAFLDSDDIWDKSKLSTQMQFMMDTKCCLSHTAYRKVDKKGDIIANHIPVSKSVNYHQLLKHNQIGTSTSMYNVEILGKRLLGNIGRTDFTLWLSILRENRVSLGIDIPLVSYRVHNNSISHNKIRSIRKTWDVYRKVENMDLLRSLYFYICNLINSSLKYLRR